MRTPMVGNLPDYGLHAGFLRPDLPAGGLQVGPSVPIITRGRNIDDLISPALREQLGQIQRSEFTGDVNQILLQIGMSMQQFSRAITSTTANLPVRENLEAESKILVPLDTPMRNKMARRMGSGLSTKWRQTISLGGGYSIATTTTSATSTTGSQSIPVVSSTGFNVGDVVIIDTLGNAEACTITAKADSTHITITTTIAVHASGSPIVRATDQPGGVSAGYVRSFFAESGAPADHATVYANQTLPYALLGTYGSVTGLAMAGGANFQNQLNVEKTNAIRNLMLNEENAIINGDATSNQAPWGDGTNALAFSGLIKSIATANGTPPDQVQGAVGALTTQHIGQQLARLWRRGARDMWMLMAEQETRSLADLAQATGSIIRVEATHDGGTVLGVKVTGFVHPVSGELIPIIPSRFMPAGTIVYGCDHLPDGSPAVDVEVLPQVQLPELAPNQDVQGYTAQDIAPTTSAPQVYPFLVSVYEVMRMKSQYHFAIDSGVTAV